jgi:hypothetical protein
MKELLTALVAAKSTFKPIPKDKVNPFHKSKYASLDAVLGAVEPSLLLNGLTLSHTVDSGRLITRLYHTSGDFLESSFNLPELSDPQKLGSVISYYRRYAVCGLLSVTADEDDDAAAASSGNAIDASRHATRECFAILGWEKDRVLEWSAKINTAPFDSWTLENWRTANTKALMEIDTLNE